MIAVISASLGGIDKPSEHIPQSLPYDYFLFTDENFPPRHRTMLPRLQAKIPKFFGWELKPNYEFYLWIDSNLTLNHPDALKFFYDQIQGYDIVVLRHPRRPNIRQEVRYTRKGLREQSIYIVGRYDGEWLKDMYRVVQNDKDFIDDLLVNGGIFMYRNTPEVQKMFKEWWYYNTRYIIQDQISFPYVLKKSGIKIKVLDIVYNEWEYLKHRTHHQRHI
jgi:hypothetical protein